MNRRNFLQLLAMSAGSIAVGKNVWADDDNASNGTSTGSNLVFTPASTGITGKHVVVVGAGMAGATVAKYLRLWGGTGIAVTLVEPNPIYVSNIMSNLVLRNTRSVSSLNYAYTNLVSRYGITLKQAHVTGFTPASTGGKVSVALSDNTNLTCDRLVMAPGIQFDDAYGLTAADYAGNYPHAWQAGA